MGRFHPRRRHQRDRSRLDCAFNDAGIAGPIGSLTHEYPGAGWVCGETHGVAGLTRAAALEYAAKGIRINAVNPGTIRTPILDPFAAAMPDFVPVMTAKHPIGHIGLPEEVAEAAPTRRRSWSATT